MRYRLTVQAEGTIYVDQNIRLEKDGFVFEFIGDETKKLTKIAVSSLVPDDRVEKFGMILREGTPESLPVFGFGGDEEIHGQLVERLQLLESNLAFETGGALKKVHWEDPEREPILETREEREIVTLPVYSIKQHYQTPTVVASTALMERATDPVPEFLLVLQAFWREGIRNFEDNSFVNAFYNFYFVIEDLYADGKTSEKEVLKSFSHLSEFCGICDETLQMFRKRERHWRNLEKFCKSERCNLDVGGLQKLVFRVRGNLHHYFRKSPRTRGTPFNQRAFESLAYLVLEMSGKAISRQRDSLKTEKASPR